MRGALGGPGVLLRRLREVMAASISPQERLDRLVVLIAGNLVAEVCSVYVLREDGSLELYATEGLNREAEFYQKRQMPPALAAALRESDSELNAQGLLVEAKRRDIEAIRSRYEQDRTRYIMLTDPRPAAGAPH